MSWVQKYWVFLSQGGINKGVWGSFLKAAVIFPWSMLSCFKVSYSGPQSFIILGLSLKLCIKVSMVWSAWAVVKMIHLRSIFWNKQWGSYLRCIGVGIGFFLLWADSSWCFWGYWVCFSFAYWQSRLAVWRFSCRRMS